MKNTGTLRIQTFAARQSAPVEGVTVTVQGDGFTLHRITDETGTAADISIEAPSCALSLQEDNTIRPYAVVDLTATKAGFRTVRIQGVQIFAGQVTLAQPEMIPETEEGLYVANPPVVIPEHSLFTGDGGSGPDPMENCMPRVLSRVIIPKNITVHLGKPAASARNVTVSFRDYIANVASSEVYPTWPEQALRANIHCQISLALNRIYTEWYPSKGYTFNITNSTSYDQYYVHGRTVFDVMVRITNDIFNTYLRKTGTVNPYYSEYCDGKSVTCPGLKQWGTVTLANQGRNALQILKYYYGNDIEIIRTSNIQSIPQSYPGSPIRQGDSGTAVFTLQRQLNRITKDYPFLGLLTVDGVFGAKMAATVRAFQKQFNLTADGVVGRQTWYKISYIYVSVKDLAELTSEGYHQGGLGVGVTNLDGGKWNTFNGYNPFIPCGYTDELGNGTGFKTYDMPTEYSENPVSVQVPRYRGIENPFGHIYQWTDGINVRISPTTENGGDGLSKVFVCEDPSKFKDNGYDGYSHVGNEARTEGYVKEIIGGEGGEIMPSLVGGGSTTYFCDYHYTNIPDTETLRGVLFGGYAYDGASAGLAFASSHYAPSTAIARIGSRLCFLPE